MADSHPASQPTMAGCSALSQSMADESIPDGVSADGEAGTGTSCISGSVSESSWLEESSLMWKNYRRVVVGTR